MSGTGSGCVIDIQLEVTGRSPDHSQGPANHHDSSLETFKIALYFLKGLSP